MKLAEIAERINSHLQRFERDPAINAEKVYRDKSGQESRLRPYYGANAHAAGRYVRVRYVSYQGGTYISKDDAVRYLAALDSGYVGRHLVEAFRGTAAQA